MIRETKESDLEEVLNLYTSHLFQSLSDFQIQEIHKIIKSHPQTEPAKISKVERNIIGNKHPNGVSWASVFPLKFKSSRDISE